MFSPFARPLTRVLRRKLGPGLAKIARKTWVKIAALGVAAEDDVARAQLGSFVDYVSTGLVRAFTRTEEARQASARMSQAFGEALGPQYTFLLSAAYFVGGCIVFGLLFLSALMGYKWLVRRRLGVFISFNRTKEDMARKLERLLTRSGMRVVRLPFREGASHQSIVTAAAAGIKKSDVFVCLPATVQSYVDHEVYAATTAEKPVLFLLAESGTLPNTADKRYPVFRLEATAQERFRPLISFLRYIGADLKATWELLMGAFRHPFLSVSFVWAVCLPLLSLGAVWWWIYLQVRDVGRELTRNVAAYAGVESTVVGVHTVVLAFAASLVFVVASYLLLLAVSLARQHSTQKRARLKVGTGEFERNDWIGRVPGLVPGGKIYECLFETAPQAHHEAARNLAAAP